MSVRACVCVCVQLANAVQGPAAGLRAGRLGGRPTTSTPASFVWTRAVSACRAAHDEVSLGNCPREASTSQGVGWVGGFWGAGVWGGEGDGFGGSGDEGWGATEREMTPKPPPSPASSFFSLPFFFFFLHRFPPLFSSSLQQLRFIQRSSAIRILAALSFSSILVGCAAYLLCAFVMKLLNDRRCAAACGVQSEEEPVQPLVWNSVWVTQHSFVHLCSPLSPLQLPTS